MAAAIEMIDVHASYGRIDVLRGVSFKVPRGTVFALLGPNGAGKSTTLLVASGRLEVKTGCLHIGGNHVNGAAPGALTRAGVCTIPEGRGIFPNLSVDDNLWVMTNCGDVSRKDVEERTFEIFPRLGERRNQLAGTLSGGEQQMLAMARAVATEPQLLLLDEISNGLAPRIVADLYEKVADLKALGISILVVEQFARMALSVADYAAIMLHGRIQAMGEPDEIEDVLSESYLGGAA